MVWRIELTAGAKKQLAKLDRHEAKRLTTFMRERLSRIDDPRILGKALTGPTLGAYWRYRVGDYRLLCDIQDGVLTILVIDISHRKDVYR